MLYNGFYVVIGQGVGQELQRAQERFNASEDSRAQASQRGKARAQEPRWSPGVPMDHSKPRDPETMTRAGRGYKGPVRV